jgi:serine protease Do
LIGENIFAIGSPKGLTNSLTKGTISGFRDNHRIQIDATIDHGSSGGPLFNERGEVIGITTSGLGTGSELNFAVNIQALPYKKYVNN